MTKTVGFYGGKFLPLHLGHTHMMQVASIYVDKLYIVLSSSSVRDRELCERDGIKYMPALDRLSWIGSAVSDSTKVEISIIHIEDDQGDEDYDWEDGAKRIQDAIGEKIDYVFSSESGYSEHFTKNFPDSEHIVIDEKRGAFPISGTEIRRDLYKNWDMISYQARPFFTKKVAIVGTESCGKTTLTKLLAEHYSTNYVREIGRDYCESYSNQLTIPMFGDIAMGHWLEQQKALDDGNKVIFVDSDAVITQYYLYMYMGASLHTRKLIDGIIRLQDYDLVLYLEPDVQWVDDGFRFAGDPEVRINNNKTLKSMYDVRGIEYTTISGDYEQRLEKSIKLVDGLFKS
ncbi:MAG: multifunctional transcriptional regulator/nicotinamide-nucleotide adenylyltransferase/ribosylnicotinamide kinase NadR [Candidatus Peribacteraceae bacterium]|nr:multifunctional transcriptional regulator/nicotinamide-nucleotide adenylyltransferase/ribosylnicotinamide kinase NadR [Candidatus Peribacteraceae bacterium]